MPNFPIRSLIPLWIGFASFVAVVVITFTAEPSVSGRTSPTAIVLLALVVPTYVAYFTLVRAILRAYGFSWLRLAVLVLVPVIPFAFLVIATWKIVEVNRHRAG